ncbi:MAG: tripartite tricarboxylate transporter substrate binding protein [Acetobacteraceae bacterium]|nr:tripartite tricarboxylate transporter substrate binding protein [Acetobacteraceae bacterium]
MTTTRRDIGRLAAGLGLAAAAPRLAAAQATPAEIAAWPSRPVTLLIPWGAGGSTDAFGRILAAHLQQILGQPFPVDNRVGANGTIGMAAGARARPDGYTVILSPNSTYAIAPLIYQTPYDAERAFTGAGLLASMPIFLMVNRDFPARSIPELVAQAKRPGARLTYANPGVGATTHLAIEWFLQLSGAPIEEVGYRGGAPAITAVLQKEATLVAMPASAVLPHIQSGDLRALAVTTAQRTPLAPDVPAMRELGFADYEVVEHLALLAPAGTPVEILRRLMAAARTALTAPEYRDRFASLAVTPTIGTPEEWPAYLAAETAKWRALVQARNIRVQ